MASGISSESWTAVIFVVAFGIVWILLELYVAAAAQLLGVPRVLTQCGLDDAVLDPFYTLGGRLTAIRDNPPERPLRGHR